MLNKVSHQTPPWANTQHWVCVCVCVCVCACVRACMRACVRVWAPLTHKLNKHTQRSTHETTHDALQEHQQLLTDQSAASSMTSATLKPVSNSHPPRSNHDTLCENICRSRPGPLTQHYNISSTPEPMLHRWKHRPRSHGTFLFWHDVVKQHSGPLNLLYFNPSQPHSHSRQ